MSFLIARRFFVLGERFDFFLLVYPVILLAICEILINKIGQLYLKVAIFKSSQVRG